MQKRSQVTVFIILGIIIVAVIFAAVYFYGEAIQDFTRPAVLDASQLEPLKAYVVGCMKDSVAADLENLKKNSGYFNPINSKVDYTGYSVNALVDKSLTSPNLMNSLTGVENGISLNVKNKIINNCNLDSFDFEIKKEIENIEVSTEIKESNVIVNLRYPLTVSKDRVSLNVDEFSLVVEDDFGKIYRAVNDVVNGEINGDFNMNEYFLQNSEVTVTRAEGNNGIVYRIVSENEKDGFVFGVKR
ncbi:hypothetical protein HY500_02090 [Candidatus Woesearchaeota archaeon]|nr:hypothetical protein [Candidatus Woesearchaeota archaeon]